MRWPMSSCLVGPIELAPCPRFSIILDSNMQNNFIILKMIEIDNQAYQRICDSQTVLKTLESQSTILH